MMKGATEKIISSTAVYGFGTMLRGVASFVLLPLYTTYLAVEDYGLVELLNIVLDLTVLVLGARVAAGIFKFYSDASTADEKSRVFGSALFLLLIVNFFAVFILFVSADAVASVLDAPDGFDDALRVFSLSLVFAACNEIYFAYLRMEDRPAYYVWMNLFKLVLQIVLNIVFIVYMEIGYWGIILGAVISNLILTIIFTIRILPEIGFHVGREQCRRLVSFSWPIIISSVGMYYITFGDRYFIQYYHTLEMVGVYALAYKFGFMLFSLVWAPFSTYWGAKQFDYAKQQGAEILFGNVFFFANIILITAAAGMVVLTPDFIHEFAHPDYWAAITVVPWIVSAYVIQCWTEYIRFGILQAARTHYIAYATYITVFMITIFYIYWIPEQGAVGAAKATLVAFAVRFGIIYYYSQRLFKIVIPWGRMLGLIAYFILLALLIDAIVPAEKWALPLKASVIVAGMVALLFTPIISKSHRVVIRQVVHEKSNGFIRRISR